MHTRETYVLFLSALRISLAPTPRTEPFHVKFVETNHTQEQKKQKVWDWNHLSLSVTVPAKPSSRRDRDLELTQPLFSTQTKTFEHEDQNATEITSALADSCIQSPWPLMSILVKTLCLSLVLMTIFLSVFHFPFLPALRLCHHQNRCGVGRVNRWIRNLAQHLEDHYREALAFSRHIIDLVFDEGKMQPDKLPKAPENAGIDLSSMRGSNWYQESTREDDDPRSSPSSRVSDVFNGTVDDIIIPVTPMPTVTLPVLLARLWYHWSQWQFLRQCVLPCHRVNTNSCHPACTRVPHSPTVRLTFVSCSVSVEPTSTTLSTLHWRNIHILAKLFRSQERIGCHTRYESLLKMMKKGSQ